jgi:hypothetical protein
MRTIPLFFTLALTTLMSCSKEDSGGNAPAGATPAAKADYSTPEKATQTLIAACARGDKKGVGACFHPDATGEFKSLVDGSVGDAEFRGLCEMFTGASVLGVEGARVKVQLTKREEQLTLAQAGPDWKVVDF